MNLKPKARAFNAGRFSPYMIGRADHEKYPYGCRELTNMLTRPQGPAFRRPGTELVADCRSHASRSRLIPFVFSSTDRYQLELSELKLRIVTGDGVILSGGSPVEVTTPWPAADLMAIHREQSNDVMYLTCPGYEPRKLSRASHTSWTLTECRYDNGPFLDENINKTILLAAGSTVKGASTSLIATGGDVFAAGNVGGLYKVSHVRPEAAYNGSFNAGAKTLSAVSDNAGKKRLTLANTTNLSAGDNLAVTGTVSNDGQYVIQTVDSSTQVTLTAAFTSAESGLSGSAVPCSAAFEVFGKWECVTHGNWDGTFQIQKSYDSGASWQAYDTYTSLMTAGAGDVNAAASGEQEDKGILFRVAMTTVASDPGLCHWDFTVEEKIVSGVVRVTAVTDARNAVCTVLDGPYATTATYRWQEGAWSARRGWPRAVCIARGRLWFGFTDHDPIGIWATRAGDYSKMDDGVESDDGIVYALTEAKQDPVYWLADLDDILAGTRSSEHAIVKATENDPFGPVNIDSPKQSKNGSEPIQPVICSDVALYVQRGGRIVREMSYTIEREGYISNDLTILAEDITEGRIVQMAYQASPYALVWCLLGNGNIAVLSYERAQNVVGWALIQTDGVFESVAVIPGAGEDEVWVTAARQINGATRRTIERFKPQDFGSQSDAFFVDCGLSFDGGAAKSITAVSVGAGPDYKVTLTATAHGLSNGQLVRLSGMGGINWLNNKVFYVADKADDTFVLKLADGSAYINGSAFGAYTGGGQALRVASTISGLSHLEGRSVQILTDGSPITPMVVTSGAITLPAGKEGNQVHVGLGYTSSLVPMPFEIPLNSGPSPSYKQRIYALVIYLYESLGLKIGPSQDKLEEAVFMRVDDPANQAPPLFTGYKTVPFIDQYTQTGEIWLVQDQPLPMTVISIEPKMEVTTS